MTIIHYDIYTRNVYKLDSTLNYIIIYCSQFISMYFCMVTFYSVISKPYYINAINYIKTRNYFIACIEKIKLRENQTYVITKISKILRNI